jgi:DNA-binding NarL/FixJ family response regulator
MGRSTYDPAPLPVVFTLRASMQPAPPSILLVDDHPVLREGLAGALARYSGAAVQQAGTAEEALGYWRSTRFDAVVLDVSLSVRSGFDLLEEARADGLEGPVVFLTAFDDPGYRLRARSLGAVAFVSKAAPVPEVCALLAQVLGGQLKAFTVVAGHPPRFPTPLTEDPLRDRLASLTRTEREVLRLLARNLTSREMARVLGTSPKTVENHRANICRKLKLRGPHRLLELALSLEETGSLNVSRVPSGPNST